MPAPASFTYSTAAIAAANAALLALLDAAGAAKIKIRGSGDELLATITLTVPSGTIDGPTGVLTLTPAADGTGGAGGSAAYGELCTGAGTVHLSLPIVAGVSPVSGSLVINDTVIAFGAPVILVSATIG